MKTIRLQKQSSTPLIVSVDRKVRPVYPDWKKRVMHPSLELSGPSKYDFYKIEVSFLHDEDTNGTVKAFIIYEHIKKMKILELCLNLQDGKIFQQRGVVVFEKLFGKRMVPLWKSILLDKFGCSDNAHIPYLYPFKGKIELYYCPLNSYFDLNCPIVHFSQKAYGM